MAPVSWKALTSSRLSSLKDYVRQKDYKATYEALSSRMRRNDDGPGGSKQTWDQWARQTLGKPYGSSADTGKTGLGVERVQLFPGWAVRRYKDPSHTDKDGAEFDLEVYVSGFASSLRPPESATRSQKAFYRLAKAYAALPKLPTVSTGPRGSSQGQLATSTKFDLPSDFDLSRLPPTPAEITDETELEALEAHFREMSASSSASSSSSSDEDVPLTMPEANYSSYIHKDETPSSSTESYGHLHHTDSVVHPSTLISSPPHGRITTSPQPFTSFPEHLVDYAAQKLHANLDARLQPFWSSAVPNRMVRLSIFCPQSGHAPSEVQDSMEGQTTDPEPVATKDVITSPQGAFQTILNVPWERLATHPPTLHIAFGDHDIEYPVVIEAEMWGSPPIPASTPSTSDPYLSYHRSQSHPQLFPASVIHAPASSSQSSHSDLRVNTRVTVPLSIPHLPLRVISDIDDTIKYTGVLTGAKNVFQNVFVRHLDELVIHSMVDWYRALWQKGVRFHYVSNSPFELLPVLTEFFQISSLPEGSIRLKSYAARSLLPALLSPAAARKRQGVVEVLDAFPESCFILVGDSGEQDMELYVELARERPRQIVGVFVRDVTSGSGQDVGSSWGQTHDREDGALNNHFGGLVVDKEPEPVTPMPSVESLKSVTFGSNNWVCRPPPSRSSLSYSHSSHSPVTPTQSMPRFPGTLPRRKSSTGMTLEERMRYELELRIERARAEIPNHTAFRVFREPEECVEAQGILERLLGSKTT